MRIVRRRICVYNQDVGELEIAEKESNFPLVSIIIAFHATEFLESCLSGCLGLDYPNFETIFVSDKKITLDYPNVRVIYTGKRLTGPAEKNDLGILHSIGEICAFINDDVFPRKDWLKNAVRHFSDPTIAAVGGPGVTPEDNNLRQKASGYIYSSILGGGSLRFRYIPQKMREVDDYPSYNLLVRKKVLQDIGGFSSTFYGGEDTKLCLVIKKNGGRILYDPNVVVYHHRRPVFKDHLKQVWNVGLHRGYFVKKFPETSFRATYFLPPTFLIGGCIMLLSAFINANVWLLLKMILLMFLTACFLSAASSRNIRIMILVMLGIPLTQITYAATFLMGLCLKDLQR